MITDDEMHSAVMAYFVVKKEVDDMKARHKAELAPKEEYLEQCKQVARLYLAGYKVNSAPFLAGTVYGKKELRTKVTDRAKLFTFVIDRGYFDLLPAAVKKDEVSKYRKENPKAPDIPGVAVDYELEIRFTKPNDPIGDEA